jgi:hypothetical protein
MKPVRPSGWPRKSPAVSSIFFLKNHRPEKEADYEHRVHILVTDKTGGEDFLILQGFQWQGTPPDQADFEALMEQAVLVIETGSPVDFNVSKPDRSYRSIWFLFSCSHWMWPKI